MLSFDYFYPNSLVDKGNNTGITQIFDEGQKREGKYPKKPCSN